MVENPEYTIITYSTDGELNWFVEVFPYGLGSDPTYCLFQDRAGSEEGARKRGLKWIEERRKFDKDQSEQELWRQKTRKVEHL